MIRRFFLFFAVFFLLPLGTHAAWWQLQPLASDWARADWSSAATPP